MDFHVPSVAFLKKSYHKNLYFDITHLLDLLKISRRTWYYINLWSLGKKLIILSIYNYSNTIVEFTKKIYSRTSYLNPDDKSRLHQRAPRRISSAHSTLLTAKFIATFCQLNFGFSYNKKITNEMHVP